MPKKRDKCRDEKGDFGQFLTDDERQKRIEAFLVRTKPEDRFPEKHERFVKHIEMLEREGSPRSRR
jgi:hypothetical protein